MIQGYSEYAKGNNPGISLDELRTIQNFIVTFYFNLKNLRPLGRGSALSLPAGRDSRPPEAGKLSRNILFRTALNLTGTSPWFLISKEKQMGKKKIFISYSRDNLEFVTRLVDSLRKKGEEVWFDSHIRSGNQWDNTIEQEVRKADVLITVLSDTSVTSHNVMDEVSLAMDLGKTIIPIKIRECEIPMRLRRYQYIDFTNDIQWAFDRLLDDINNVENPKPTRRPPRPKPAKKSGGLVPFLIGGLVFVAIFVVIGIMATDKETGAIQPVIKNEIREPGEEELTGKNDGNTNKDRDTKKKEPAKKDVLIPVDHSEDSGEEDYVYDDEEDEEEIPTSVGVVIYQNPYGQVTVNKAAGGYPQIGDVLFALTPLEVYNENRYAIGDYINVGEQIKVLDIYPMTQDGFIFLKVTYLQRGY